MAFLQSSTTQDEPCLTYHQSLYRGMIKHIMLYIKKKAHLRLGPFHQFYSIMYTCATIFAYLDGAKSMYYVRCLNSLREIVEIDVLLIFAFSRTWKNERVYGDHLFEVVACGLDRCF